MRSRKCVGKQENDWCFVGDKGALKQGSLEEKLWIKENDTMREGRLGYNCENDRYGLLSMDLWIDTGFHCGEYMEVLVDDQLHGFHALLPARRLLRSPVRKWWKC